MTCGAHQAWAADRSGSVAQKSVTPQESVTPLADEGEHGEDDCHTRRTPRSSRTLATPSWSGPPQRPLDCRWTAPPAPHSAGALPETGSAGMPWRRSVEVPVLHQVFLH